MTRTFQRHAQEPYSSMKKWEVGRKIPLGMPSKNKNCPERDIVLFGREEGKINPIYLHNHKWDIKGREGGSVSCLIIYIFQRFACQQVIL